MSETAPIDVDGLAAWLLKFAVENNPQLFRGEFNKLNEAAAALQSLSAELERTKRERDGAVDLEEMQAKSLDEEETRSNAVAAALQQALAERDEARAALSAETEACAKAVDNVREGNMMLDNEPVLFVKGFEMACVEGAAAIRQRQGERS